MQLKKQLDQLFKPLLGQKTWGVSLGVGSFVTLEFGQRILQNHHYHGEWHLWLYMCEWELNSKGRVLANSESKRKVMELAIDNLNGAVLNDFSSGPQRAVTEFIFEKNLRMRCSPFSDAVRSEEYWILFTPDGQTAALTESGLKYEATSRVEAPISQREAVSQRISNGK